MAEVKHKVQVSIILVNYNQFQLTCDCIESIIDKTKGVTYEIIVVDNGSKGDDILKITKLFPQVKLIESEKNLGFSKGNNLGIANATGDFILLLNNDTILQNDAVSQVCDFLYNQPNVGVCTASLVYPDGAIQHNCQRFPSIKYKLIELFRLQKLLSKRRRGLLLFGSFFDHIEVAYPDWVWGTFFMFPRGILELFDSQRLPDDFFMYWEDVQWCKELQRKGRKIAYLPSARVVHISSGSKGPKSRYMIQNEKLFMAKYYTKFERVMISLLDKML